MKDYIIDQIGWHTKVVGNTESVDRIHKRFKNISVFLESEGLTTRKLIELDTPLKDDFCIKVSDLTDEGFLLMQKSYDKWLRFLDKGKSPDNLSILEKTLTKIRMNNTFVDSQD